MDTVFKLHYTTKSKKSLTEKIISYHIMLHGNLYHITSYHIMSCHIISYHIISPHTIAVLRSREIHVMQALKGVFASNEAYGKAYNTFSF